jgi:sugar phosphate isomerase/epimerase
VIRIFAGHQPEGQSAARTHALIVDGINACCEHAGQHGVHLALENHGGPTLTAAGLLAIVKDVDSPWFGVNLDTGNFRGEDVYAEIAAAAPYAINVQVKVVVSGSEGRKEPTDYNRIANILRDVNYRGYVVLEYEEDGDPREQSKRHLEQLRAAFTF